MSILYKEIWKNRINEKRKVLIYLINRLMKIATEENEQEIEQKYDQLINYLGSD